MITKIVGNLLDITSGVIVHGCNAHGVMGSGFAKQVKTQFPKAFAAYRHDFEKPIVAGWVDRLGTYTWAQVSQDKYIINAITQRDYGRDPNVVYVDYDALERAFIGLATGVLKDKVKQLGVHFPLIGCGLANGDWSVVSQIIDYALGPDIEKTLWVLE